MGVCVEVCVEACVGVWVCRLCGIWGSQAIRSRWQMVEVDSMVDEAKRYVVTDCIGRVGVIYVSISPSQHHTHTHTCWDQLRCEGSGSGSGSLVYLIA